MRHEPLPTQAEPTVQRAWTPGPWSAGLAEIDEGHVVREQWEVSAGDDCDPVAELWHGVLEVEDQPEREITVETAEANAHLISAAPDLFAALAEFAVLGHGKCVIGKPLADMTRAALAKALGQPSAA